MKKIGRNDPCSCGSGKKYKKCCGDEVSSGAVNERKPDNIAINKEIAYKGKIGLQREKFCINYINNKKENLLLIEQSQVKMTKEAGEAISCLIGCHYCCLAYVEASIQECEAIVYYLYGNDEILNTFLHNYTEWRGKIKRNGDLFRKISRRWHIDTKPRDEKIISQRFDEINKEYYRQNITCPFLHNSLCLIYEVRPYTCAALITTSPPDWCRPDNLHKSNMLAVYTPDALNDFSFYYGEFTTRVLSFMPLTVYEILRNGTYYLSHVVPGLENLNSEFYADPDILNTLNKWRV